MKIYSALILTIGLMTAIPSAATAQSTFEDYYHLLYKYEGYHANQKFGDGVYLAGDVNGDGYGDILIGAYGEDVGSMEAAGRAYVHSGFDGSLLYTYAGEGDHDFLGWALSDIEDTNGDGFPEILIGAQDTNVNGLTAAGKVYHCSGIDGSVIREYGGETWGDRFGCDLEGIGDADGDGWGDFIVGAKYYDDGPPNKRGAVYVFSGHTGALIHKYEGEYISEQLGFKVCRMGDVDKIVWDDFAYLTLNNKMGIPSNGGRVTVCSGASGSAIQEIYGSMPDDPIGEIEYGGDINGDGWPDLLASQWTFDNGLLEMAGRVIVYSGNDWRPLYVIIGQSDGLHLGKSLSTAGDIDNDGYSDFAAGGHGTNEIGVLMGGAVYVHSGKDGSRLCALYGQPPVHLLGISLHGGGDVNADGLPDIIVGTSEDVGGIPSAGSALVYAAKSLQALDQVPLGGALTLNFHVPAQPFFPFYLAFALGKEPGLPLGTRTLPLNGDALFALTFGNPAFAGSFDGEGKAQVQVTVPNEPILSGLVFYGAFVTVDMTAPKWVRTISNPEKIEIL